MAKKKSAKNLYLTKRILLSAAKSGVKQAAKETMDVMGYVVVAHEGWIVKKLPDGSFERIAPIEPVENTEFALD
jgi:hypothetical protein